MFRDPAGVFCEPRRGGIHYGKRQDAGVKYFRICCPDAVLSFSLAKKEVASRKRDVYNGNNH